MRDDIIKKRIEAASIDFFTIAFPVILVVIITSFFIPNENLINLMISAIGTSIIFLALIFKDFWGKGKKLVGLTIISVHNGKEASKKQKFARNLTLLIYPLELIYLKAYGFRLGDSLAGTDVIFASDML